MNTTFAETPVITNTSTYEIIANNGLFYVTRNGTYLTNRFGMVRTFITRNAARKRISRERTGNFHA